MFATPMLIGNLFQQAYSMVDAIIVGRYISGHALAAVGVSMSVLFFLGAILMGITTGASVLISQFYGARQQTELERTVSTSIVFMIGFSVLIGGLGVAFSPQILSLLDVPPEIFDDAVLYMRVLLGGIIFPAFYNVYTAYLRALGDSRNPLYILIFCTTLNAGLNLLFVVVLGMGIGSVAASTVIAQGFSAALCYLYIRRNVPLLHSARLTYCPKMFRAILKYGTPAAIQLSLVSLAQLTITRLVNNFGADAAAGITAAVRIDQFAMMPIQTVSLALSTFVAQNMGAGKEARALNGMRSSTMFMVGLAVAMSAVVIASGPQLMSMFLNEGDANTPGILSVGTGYLNVMAMFYFLFAFLFAFNGFFRGVGDAVMAMVFPVVSLTIRTVSAYLMVGLAGMGPEALAWSIPIGWGITSFASFVYYKRRLWVGKVAAKAEPEDDLL